MTAMICSKLSVGCCDRIKNNNNNNIRLLNHWQNAMTYNHDKETDTQDSTVK